MNQDESPSVENGLNTFSDAKERLKQTAAQVKQQAEKLARQRKSGLADQIDDYRETIDQTADNIDREDPNLAWLSHQVSDRLRRASDYIRTTDFETIHNDAEDVARRHPALFFGGLFLGGMVIGNLLKASAIELPASRPRRAASLTGAYPENEDVVRPRDETAPWPAMPASEVIK